MYTCFEIEFDQHLEDFIKKEYGNDSLVLASCQSIKETNPELSLREIIEKIFPRVMSRFMREEPKMSQYD